MTVCAFGQRYIEREHVVRVESKRRMGKGDERFMAEPAPAIKSSVSATWPAMRSRCKLRPRVLPVILLLLD